VVAYYAATATWLVAWAVTGTVNLRLAALAWGDLRAISLLGPSPLPALLARTHFRSALLRVGLSALMILAGVAALFLPVLVGPWQALLEVAVDLGAVGIAAVSSLDLRDRVRLREKRPIEFG
jgi:hypothetical protein